MSTVRFAPLVYCPGNGGVGCGTLIDAKLAACFGCRKRLPTSAEPPRPKDARSGKSAEARRDRSSPRSSAFDLRAPGVSTSTKTTTRKRSNP